MNDADRLLEGLEEIGGLLDAPHLDPDPGRKDWPDQVQALSTITSRLESEVLGILGTSTASMHEEDREQVELNAAFLTAEVAALLCAAGRGDEGRALATRACSLSTGEPTLEAAVNDLEGYTLLTRARWLYRHKKQSAADTAFKKAQKLAKDPVIREAADRGYNAPKPISSAPPLFRINGCGFGLYGTRDERPDGTHVATYCISLLFIPVFPLTAYRIFDHGDNSYAFIAKERLSGFARGYRNLLLASVVLFFAFTGIVGYLESPERKAGIALSEAQEVEASGDARAAIARYEKVVEEYGYASDAGDRAAEAIIRLEAKEAPQPFKAEHMPIAEKLIGRFRRFPRPVKEGPAGDQLADQLVAWAKEVNDDERAALRLLDLTQGMSTRAAERVRAHRVVVSAKLAEKIADREPIAALRLFLDADRKEEAAELAKMIAESPSLLLAHRSLVSQVSDPAVAEAITRAEAGARAPDRQAVLENRKRKKLTKYLAKHPKDQEVAAALAEIHRNRGKVDVAIKTLQGIGDPGWMVPDAQRLLASLYLDAGRLEDAAKILEPLLAERLPAFAAARRSYTSALKAFQDKWINKAKYGGLPKDIDTLLSTASREDAPKIFMEWLSQKQSEDQNLARLRDRYEALSDVVPASVTLGTVELRRANEATGAERQRLLSKAEEAFLGIRAEGEGLPSYHLGLGQVYHRLGRPEEGDKELEGVLAQNDHFMVLAVSRVYRELGLIKKAREVAERVWKTGNKDAKREAALMMSLLVNSLEEEETWLRRVPGQDKYITNRLNEVQARRLLEAGKLAQADKLFAKVAANYDRQSAHSSASANNAALVYQSRFLCTGDEGHLKKSIRGLERALKLEPDSALVLGNLAYGYSYMAEVELLGAYIDSRLLPLGVSDAGKLLRSLTRGPMRKEVLEALEENVALKRSVELSRQEEALAPERTTAYRRALSFASMKRDQAQLSALAGRLKRLKKLDTTQEDERMASYSHGDDDQRILRSMAASLEDLDRRLAKAKKKRHKPTIAAIHFLKADLLESRVAISGDVADATAAAKGFAKAGRVWPRIAASDNQAWALVRVAVLNAARSSAELKELWDDNHRELGVSLTLYRGLKGPDRAAIVEALRAEPALAEAVKLAGAMEDEQLRTSEWVLAEVAGDKALAARAAKVFQRPVEKLEHEIAVRLNPNAKATKVSQEMFATNG